MPQNNVLPDWRATYPNDAPVQKPSGVTVSTTATAPRVPNKHTYNAGTIQSYDADLGQMVYDKVVGGVLERVRDRVEEAAPEEVVSETQGEEEVPHTQDEVEEADMEEAEENGEDGEPRRTTTKRTTTRTTTHRRR